MRMWAKSTSRAALVAAGALAVGVAFGSAANAAALADDGSGGGSGGSQNDQVAQSSQNAGMLDGTQVYAPISVPINACGNAIPLVGTSEAGCMGGANVGDRNEQQLPSTLQTPLGDGNSEPGNPIKSSSDAKYSPQSKQSEQSEPSKQSEPSEQSEPSKSGKHGKKSKPSKLPSTLRADGRRMASPGKRTAGGLPPVQQVLNRLRGAIRPEVHIVPGQIGTLPVGGAQPMKLGSPTLH